MTKLTQAQVDRIVALGDHGKSGSQISAITGIPSATVNYRLLRAGIDPWPAYERHQRSNQPGAFTAEEDAQLLELAKSLPMMRVAKAMDRAITSIRIRLMTLEIRADKAA